MALPKLEQPTYKLKLPSNGEQVIFRPFLVKEYKILLTLSEADDDEVSRIVKELVDVCTFNKLTINNLPHYDIEYLFLNLRAKSISENVEVVVNCDCGEKIDHTFNIEDLKVTDDKNKTNKVQLNEEIGVELKPLGFNEIVKLTKNDNVDNLLSVLSKTIKSIFTKDQVYDTVDQSDEEIKEFVSSLNSQQFKKIEEYISKLPKVVQRFSVKCPACGNINNVVLQGLENFFV